MKRDNRLFLRIPKALAAKTRLEEGTTVSIFLEAEQIVIRPIAGHEWTLEKLLRGVTKHNRHREFDTGVIIGREEWLPPQPAIQQDKRRAAQSRQAGD